CSQQGIVVTTLTAHANAAVVEESATATAGREQFVAGRVVNHGLGDLTTMHESNRNGVQRQAMDEIGGSIDGIDDPLEFRRVCLRTVGSGNFTGFLAQKSM